jgi:hypothetical protein
MQSVIATRVLIPAQDVLDKLCGDVGQRVFFTPTNETEISLKVALNTHNL